MEKCGRKNGGSKKRLAVCGSGFQGPTLVTLLHATLKQTNINKDNVGDQKPFAELGRYHFLSPLKGPVFSPTVTQS